jgi:hypothetical protein
MPASQRPAAHLLVLTAVVAFSPVRQLHAEDGTDYRGASRAFMRKTEDRA